MDLAGILITILNIVTLLLVGRVIISWIDPGLRWQFSRAIFSATEPILSPIRQVLPRMGVFDMSTFVALILIQVLSRLIVSSIG